MITAIISIASVALVALAFLGIFVPNWNSFCEFVQSGVTMMRDVLPTFIPSYLLVVFGVVLSVLLMCKIINR